MSNGAARKRARKRHAKAVAASPIVQNIRARQEQREVIYKPPYDPLADETWNRHVVHWEAGELDARFWAEEEADGWLSLSRWGGRGTMFYHPGTRRAYWTGFEPRVEFFIKDIEAYIHLKFTT